MKLFDKRFGGRLPLPGVLTDNVFGYGPIALNHGQTKHGENDEEYKNQKHKQQNHDEAEAKPGHYIFEEIKRLREENAYLSSLIKSLVPLENTKNYQKKSTPSPAAIQISQQHPEVLKLRKNKNNSKFIIPIFKADEDNDNQNLDQIQPDKITKSKLYGLDLLKRTPLTDSSWRFHTTRFRRSLQESHAENLVLKRPSVFNKPTLITRLKTGMDPVSASPLITNSEPSTFYQVPPPGPSGPGNSASNIQLPPEHAGTSFYESNQDDVSLDPSLVIQELQQQVISYLYLNSIENNKILLVREV